MIGFTKPQERVARGIALLDAHCPDWPWRVNTDQLDLFSNKRCVLGQLYGNFGKALKALPFMGWPTGFMPNLGDIFSVVNAPTDRLTAAWRETIESRRRCEWAAVRNGPHSTAAASATM
jgi:hypothetical protein